MREGPLAAWAALGTGPKSRRPVPPHEFCPVRAVYRGRYLWSYALASHRRTAHVRTCNTPKQCGVRTNSMVPSGYGHPREELDQQVQGRQIQPPDLASSQSIADNPCSARLEVKDPVTCTSACKPRTKSPNGPPEGPCTVVRDPPVGEEHAVYTHSQDPR
uniref:Uncharacterized protein n=1 Tax=Ananas comosus var. bracteatus TaxID=296719 RepID=A0A6V7NJ43_ANACO|nr:unnamed protein product [Ananas comosus var. bracteatus]